MAIASARHMVWAMGYIIVAGLLNMLVALDAFDIAAGRK